MNTTIIGIDCAAQDENIGLALGHFDGLKTCIEKVTVGSSEKPIVKTIIDWINDRTPVLLALDAPLGWPKYLSQVLICHEAGKPIPVEISADEMFRRETDQVVGDKIKQPLDVGADKIARATYSALGLLQMLRDESNQQILLAWSPLELNRIHAIEVYPAATLKAYKLPYTGYKGKDERNVNLRKEIFDALKRCYKVRIYLDALNKLQNNHNALDAAICVLAGVDFLRGNVIRPKDIKLAEKEGWIWVRDPGR